MVQDQLNTFQCDKVCAHERRLAALRRGRYVEESGRGHHARCCATSWSAKTNGFFPGKCDPNQSGLIFCAGNRRRSKSSEPQTIRVGCRFDGPTRIHVPSGTARI